MIQCIHCTEWFETMEKNWAEGRTIYCIKCKGLTPYQKSREVSERISKDKTIHTVNKPSRNYFSSTERNWL